jgi:hypothetical protein
MKRSAAVNRVDDDSQGVQARDHHLSVFAVERAVQHGIALRQRGANQRPVRNAFRPRRPNSGVKRPRNRLNFD